MITNERGVQELKFLSGRNEMPVKWHLTFEALSSLKVLFELVFRFRMENEVKLPERLSLDEIISDLSSIALNQQDVLFEDLSGVKEEEEERDEDALLYDKLEKLVLLRAVDQGNSAQKFVKAREINQELESLEKRVESLQHFINLSKKFLSSQN